MVYLDYATNGRALPGTGGRLCWLGGAGGRTLGGSQAGTSRADANASCRAQGLQDATCTEGSTLPANLRVGPEAPAEFKGPPRPGTSARATEHGGFSAGSAPATAPCSVRMNTLHTGWVTRIIETGGALVVSVCRLIKFRSTARNSADPHRQTPDV
jgi:hypothetical protein